MSELKWYFQRLLESWGYGSCDVSWDASGAPESWSGFVGNPRRLLFRIGVDEPVIRAIEDSSYDLWVDGDSACLKPRVGRGSMGVVDTTVLNQVECDLESRLRAVAKTRSRYAKATHVGADFHEVVARYSTRNLRVCVAKHTADLRPWPMLDPVDQYLRINRLAKGEAEVFDLVVEIQPRNGFCHSLRVMNVTDDGNGFRWRRLAIEAMHQMDIATRRRINRIKEHDLSVPTRQ